MATDMNKSRKSPDLHDTECKIEYINRIMC